MAKSKKGKDMSVAEVVEPRERIRLEDVLAHGFRLAEEEGTENPRIRHAIWQLIREAVQTLAWLPDKERVWHTSGKRSGHPPVFRTYEENLGAIVQRLQAGEQAYEEEREQFIPDASAIDRMNTVLGWMSRIETKNTRRDLKVVCDMALGCGIIVLERNYGKSHRNNWYQIRDRVVRKIETHVFGPKNAKRAV